MTMNPAKVIQVEMSKGEIMLYEFGKFCCPTLVKNAFRYNPNEKEDLADYHESIDVNVQIKVGTSLITRSNEIKFKPKPRKILSKTQSSNIYSKGFNYEFCIPKEEIEEELLKLMNKTEHNFWFTENELIQQSHKLLEGQYDYVHFRTHITIEESIIDGIAFIQQKEGIKIIGFEAKTDHDNFNRLYTQMNSYLNICDEVYLVLQSKETPKDLPFYIGILRVKEGKIQVERRPQTLKHEVNENRIWKIMVENLNRQVQIKVTSHTKDIFGLVENIKKKLLWNQYVVGYRTHWADSYVDLDDKEKKLLQGYYAGA